ncbi:MAG: sulfatase family protein [Planctomycetota bacterium]
MNDKTQIKRRQFLQTAGVGAASALLSRKSARAESSAPGSNRVKPNVLLIMTDQHRADLMTCAGRDLVPTPNVDRIASRGVRFNNAYCPYPVCVASRMALLTGLYSHSTGAIYYMSINDWLMYLGPKVQHYANEIANHPLGPNFFKTVDDSGAGLPDIDGLWLRGSPWVGNVEKWNFDHMASPLEAEDHLDSFIARESGKFITRYREQPFFLVTSFMKPHSPFYPPRQWAEKYPVDKMTLPEVGDISGYPKHIQRRIRNRAALGEKRQRAHRAGYLGNLAFVDTCVGYVYDVLEKEGLLDSTIVVYTADHGEMDGDHGLFQKFCLFEPSVQVPLIVSWPKHLPENKVTDALTEYIGLYPTLSDLAGIEAPRKTTLHKIPGAPERLDARSFADIVRNPDLRGPSAAFSEYNLRSTIPEYMIRTRRYKYIYNHGATHELYDHEADPGEFVNRIDEPALKKIQNRLHDRLFTWYNPEKNPYRPERT